MKSAAILASVLLALSGCTTGIEGILKARQEGHNDIYAVWCERSPRTAEAYLTGMGVSCTEFENRAGADVPKAAWAHTTADKIRHEWEWTVAPYPPPKM
jgi:hypothetical protein